MKQTDPDAQAFADEASAGLTKREYFADHIMAALMHSLADLKPHDPASVALFAVAAADALIRRLNMAEPKP